VGVEEAVDELYEVSALLVAAVDTALDLQRFDGVDLGVADDVLEAPLGIVDPVLAEEVMLDRVLGVLVSGVAPIKDNEKGVLS